MSVETNHFHKTFFQEVKFLYAMLLRCTRDCLSRNINKRSDVSTGSVGMCRDVSRHNISILLLSIYRCIYNSIVLFSINCMVSICLTNCGFSISSTSYHRVHVISYINVLDGSNISDLKCIGTLHSFIEKKMSKIAKI